MSAVAYQLWPLLLLVVLGDVWRAGAPQCTDHSADMDTCMLHCIDKGCAYCNRTRVCAAAQAGGACSADGDSWAISEQCARTMREQEQRDAESKAWFVAVVVPSLILFVVFGCVATCWLDHNLDRVKRCLLRTDPSAPYMPVVDVPLEVRADPA